MLTHRKSLSTKIHFKYAETPNGRLLASPTTIRLLLFRATITLTSSLMRNRSAMERAKVKSRTTKRARPAGIPGGFRLIIRHFFGPVEKNTPAPAANFIETPTTVAERWLICEI